VLEQPWVLGVMVMDVGDVVVPGLEVVDVVAVDVAVLAVVLVVLVVLVVVVVVVAVVVVLVVVVVDDVDDEPPLHLPPPLEDLGVLAEPLVPWVKRIYNDVYE